VLQNLVINASEATRAADRGYGTIRIAASIARTDGEEQLLITCGDCGAGIAADHLERIFERGFSTKGDSKSRGIGLHWCATAISALGGRIWATSPGPGLGATFHVALPISFTAAVPAVAAA
jgi:signal transduction histidine kinase